MAKKIKRCNKVFTMVIKFDNKQFCNYEYTKLRKLNKELAYTL